MQQVKTNSYEDRLLTHFISTHFSTVPPVFQLSQFNALKQGCQTCGPPAKTSPPKGPIRPVSAKMTLTILTVSGVELVQVQVPQTCNNL